MSIPDRYRLRNIYQPMIVMAVLLGAAALFGGAIRADRQDRQEWRATGRDTCEERICRDRGGVSEFYRFTSEGGDWVWRCLCNDLTQVELPYHKKSGRKNRAH